MLKDLRLVGGTALALQLGHRNSIDLDFFGVIDKTTEQIIDELGANGFNVRPEYESKTIKMLVIDEVKVDIVGGHAKWFSPPIEMEGVRMAGLQDIAAMKLHAITGRGRKKDFIDLYVLLQHFSLEQMLELYEKKYPQNNLFFVIRSLSYFSDAESDPMPKMFIDVGWEEMKSAIRNAIEKL
jgi:predicted nucleotidyltransferase component of viral defense system